MAATQNADMSSPAFLAPLRRYSRTSSLSTTCEHQRNFTSASGLLTPAQVERIGEDSTSTFIDYEKQPLNGLKVANESVTLLHLIKPN